MQGLHGILEELSGIVLGFYGNIRGFIGDT
jgi:hypothetical protein